MKDEKEHLQVPEIRDNSPFLSISTDKYVSGIASHGHSSLCHTNSVICFRNHVFLTHRGSAALPAGSASRNHLFSLFRLVVVFFFILRGKGFISLAFIYLLVLSIPIFKAFLQHL